MKLLIKSATILDTSSKYNGKKRDVLISNGVIEKIAAKIELPKGYKKISFPNLHISKGWFDSSTSFGEPGYEDRETLQNGLQTAALSGFTSVAVNANTFPVIDSKSDIEFLKSKAQQHAVNLYPIGALTMNAEGETLAELFDMQNSGAVCFYDYQKPIKNANLLKIALQYTQPFNGLVQSFPMDQTVAENGVMNEEVTSTSLGLKGIPALSEELQIIRDLYILEYTEGSLHIPTISTKKAVSLIKEAKKKGLDVSCSVSINNLVLTDDALTDFNTNLKVLPPLRTQNDVNALIKGIQNGVIDGVTSEHNPIDIENKKTEFDHALFGSIGLESCFGALNTIVGKEKAVDMLCNLKNRFGVKQYTIETGNEAEITFFNPDEEYIFTEDLILSTSKNAALLGKVIKGKAYGIYSNKKLIITND